MNRRGRLQVGWAVAICCLIAGWVFLSETAAANAAPPTGNGVAVDEGFVPVSLENRENISGKMLVVTAYSVIFGVLILYVFSIVRREKQVENTAKNLKKSLKNSM